MRCFTLPLSVLAVCLLAAASALAEPIEVAKVYRDYPGYINPAVCDNPNLDKPAVAPPATAVPPEGMSAPAVPPATQSRSCEAVPYAYRSDNPVDVPYLTVWAGWVATQDNDVDDAAVDATFSFNNGFGGGAAIGYDFGPARVEIEGSYRRSEVDEVESGSGTTGSDEELEVRALLVNAYADFTTGGMVTPYLGAGIGYAEVEVGSGDDGVFAGQAAAGMLFALTPAVAIDLGYRFMMTDKPEIDHVKLEEVKQHTALLGLQIRF